MITSKPLVSLCCSTHSRPDVFAFALKGLLRQTYAPLEIVVLVDGSNPLAIALLNACDDPRLRWFATSRPSGMVAAWNKVVAASRGKYFLYCADDDVLCDSAIESQVELLETHPNVGFCHADFYLINDEGDRIGQWQSHEGTWIKAGLAEWQRYLAQPKCCMQTCVIRRDLWERVGGWDGDAGYPGDNSLYLKLLRLSDVGHVARFACSYRIRTRHPDSWRKNANKVQADFALASKHLMAPPESLRAQVPALERMVRKHLAHNALAVLADHRGTAEERAEFASWVLDELLYRSRHQMLYRWLLRLHLERALSRLKSLDQFSRAVMRTALASINKMTTNQTSLKKTA